jgi:lipopolysaccharide transport system ATP-binding protein
MNSLDLAVSVRGLDKVYRITDAAARPATMAEAVLERIRRPFRREPRSAFKALDDVSFDIRQGEVVGIIGRNGAGKSTLLKVLSRITEPSAGRVELYGRVGSLLEVGTGFHPELTGRENVYLNGAILGMAKSEIRRQFDAIVDFSGVEKFLDTPVKRYSSGMYVRLAFAVAAHLQSDILIVDEVLAVGDANFQNKCLGKMQEVGQTGRTVIFVSHSMPMIQRLCRTGIVLDGGRVQFIGEATTAALEYMRGNAGRSFERVWADPAKAPRSDAAVLLGVVVLDGQHRPRGRFDVREPVMISIEYRCMQPGRMPIAAIHVINGAGIILFASADFTRQGDEVLAGTTIRATCLIPANLLAEGEFTVLAALVSYNPDILHVCENDAVTFMTVDQSKGDGVRGSAATAWPGVLRPKLEWIDGDEFSAVATD